MDEGFCYSVIVASVFFIVLILHNANQSKKEIAEANKKRRKQLADAREAYQESLAILKLDPANADLRQQVLEMGRKYARMAREGGQETVFDEVALLNDMNAIVGSEGSRPDHKIQIPNDDISARLKKLENLKAQGLINNDEYEKRRSAILDSI